MLIPETKAVHTMKAILKLHLLSDMDIVTCISTDRQRRD
jgi:hypothetical protein